MIKLIISSESVPPTTKHFDQSSILIGGEHAIYADIKLAELSLPDRCIQIIRQIENGAPIFFVLNLANDPLITLNNLPFEKQALHPHDVLKIGDYSIHFDYEISSQPIPKLSLKDYYLSEYDDEEDYGILKTPKQTAQLLTPELAKTWRAGLILFGGVTAVLSLVIGILYLWLSDQTEEEETRAAKAVADIAMALTYAQLKHIHPQNQNWAYPEFIRSNLNAVLAPDYIPLAEIDGHGQFVNCPYMLRIYTSSDLSQFLVIAQPSPSVLHWFVPKASIVVDSRAMELRKVIDLKPLNRLIVNTNHLDGNNTGEISHLIKQGELIPLSSLVSKAENQGLLPPKALSLMRPGAENFIYNIPRYYLLGESFLHHSINIVEKPGDPKEIQLLQQELMALLQYPDFVFYSSEGISRTLQARKALLSLLPEEPLLIAHLQFNPHGKITSTHLLIDNSASNIALNDSKGSLPNDSLLFPEDNFEHDIAVFHAAKTQLDSSDSDSSNFEIDKNEPIFLKLVTAATLRQSALMPIAEQMNELLMKHTLAAQPHFHDLFVSLQQRYAETDQEQLAQIFMVFDEILKDSAHIPAAKLLEYVQSANLKIFFQEYLLNFKLLENENLQGNNR